jgi:hypothetical protein
VVLWEKRNMKEQSGFFVIFKHFLIFQGQLEPQRTSKQWQT